MSDFHQTTGTSVSKQNSFSGFQFVSPYLLKNLRPAEVILYYSIHHFNLTKSHRCYAKTATLMKLSGIGSRRNFSRSLRSLLDKGLIIQRGTNRYGCNIYETLFPDPKSGPAVLKSFLFNHDIGAGEKVINVAVLGFPRMTKREIAGKLKYISKSSIYHARILPKSDVFYLPYGMQNGPGPVCKNSHPNNYFKNNNKRNYSTYTNLLGDRVGGPEYTDPVVILEKGNREKEKKEIEIQKQKDDALKKHCIDLFSESKKWTLLLDDLDKIYPNIPMEVKVQSIWASREKYHAGKITKTTPTGYAIGIIRQYIKMFQKRKFMPTIPRIKEIVEDYEKKQKIRAKMKQKRKELEKMEADNNSRKMKNLRRFIGLNETERMHLLDAYIRKYDPRDFLLSKLSLDDKINMVCASEDFENFMLK
jgi:hypothetical protein